MTDSAPMFLLAPTDSQQGSRQSHSAGDVLAVPTWRGTLPLQVAIDLFCAAAGLGGSLALPLVDGRWAGIRPGLTVADVAAEIEAALDEESFDRDLTHTATTLRWGGVWTSGRWLAVADLGNGNAIVEWDTGTARPSRWLGGALEVSGVVTITPRHAWR